jgi:hypothetical protein
MATTFYPHPNAASILPKVFEGATPKGSVDEPNPEWVEMARDWVLIQDLLGGTSAMRKRNKLWLPQEPAEDDEAYKVRLARSVLYNGLGDTIEKLAARPFAKPIGYDADLLPEKLRPFIDNIDLEGRTLDEFGAEWLRDAMAYGMSHALVDFTAEEELTAEHEGVIHPYLVMVSAPALFAWRWDRVLGGRQRLTQVRIRECVTEQDGDWGAKEVEQIRVWNAPGAGEEAADGSPSRRAAVDNLLRFLTKSIDSRRFEADGGELGTWAVHRKDAKGNWVEHAGDTHTFPGVPLVTLYTKQTGFMTAKSPLMDLAWLNLAHWQSDSDQRNILRFARVPLIHQAGITKKEADEPVVIAAGNVIRSTSKDADMRYVEHTGAGIEAGRHDLESLESKMRVLGNHPLESGSAPVGRQETATGRRMDEERTMSALQSWVRREELALGEATGFAHVWVAEEQSEDLRYNIHDQFHGPQTLEEARLQFDAARAGKLSTLDMLEGWKKRGLIPEDANVDEYLERIESEAPSFDELVDDDAFGGGGDGGGGDDGGDGGDGGGDDGDE